MSKLTKLTNWRDQLGRVGTIYGAGLLAAAMYTPDAAVYGAPAVAVAAGLGVVTCVRPWRDDVPAELVGLYLTPATTLIGGMVAVRLVDGVHVAEGVGTLLWAGFTWWLRPGRIALHMLAADVDQDEEEETEETAVVLPPLPDDATPEDRLIHWWALAMAREGGAAPGTWLENARVDGPKTFTADIVAPHGTPVPTVAVSVLSSRTDIPAALIKVEPVPGRGDGRRRLVVRGEQAAGTDLHGIWSAHVAGGRGMPGAVIRAVRYGNTETNEEIAS